MRQSGSHRRVANRLRKLARELGISDSSIHQCARNWLGLARRPIAELISHSARGLQYTSDAYWAALAQANISVSMTRNVLTRRFRVSIKMGQPQIAYKWLSGAHRVN